MGSCGVQLDAITHAVLAWSMRESSIVEALNGSRIYKS
jgi:hypothetical protein